VLRIERGEKAGRERERRPGEKKKKKGARIRESREERQMEIPKGLYAI
jgi:hypothetical protein